MQKQLQRILLFFIICLLFGQTAAYAAQQITSLDELDGKRIGVQTGSTEDQLVLDRLPNARLSYFSTIPDMAAALEANKIDGFSGNTVVLSMMSAQDPLLYVLDEPIESYDCGIVLAKNARGEALRKEINVWLSDMRERGELDRILEKWTEGPESERTIPDYESFPATKGVLTMATEGTYQPWNYYRGDEIVGMEVDLAALFCEANGYGLDIDTMTFDSLLMAIQTEKADFAMSGIAITEERQKSVLFSDPYYSSGTVLAVLNTESVLPSGITGLWDSILGSFKRTFISENRWRLFVQGVETTALITVLSALFGSLCGFILFMLCRKGNRAANAITGASFWVVQGMPTVVLLMVLYYIVFGRFSLSGIIVSIVAFTLTFGASVFGLLKTGVGAVDIGQYEAAVALGYSDRRTFYRFILPQALPHVMPSYRGELISLLKATSVVGYIAVQDLTKMGDIVRSRTYEAFFPLIAVTVIYFILEGVISLLGRRAEKALDPHLRKPEQILRGTNADD